MKIVDLSEKSVSTCWECGSQSGTGIQIRTDQGPVLCSECVSSAFQTLNIKGKHNDRHFDFILSGPITGTTDFVQRFDMAYCRVRQSVFSKTGNLPNVWNPAILPAGRSNEWYMRRCHEAIFDSPNCVLVQLTGWQNSKGSLSEYALCVSLGRVVSKEEDYAW